MFNTYNTSIFNMGRMNRKVTDFFQRKKAKQRSGMTRIKILRFTQMKSKLIAMPYIRLVLLIDAYQESLAVKWLSTHSHFIQHLAFNFQRKSVVTEKGRATLTGFKNFSVCIMALGWLGCFVPRSHWKVLQTKTLRNTCDERVCFLVKFQVECLQVYLN